MRIFYFFVFLLTTFNCISQNFKIQGKVLDEEKEPVEFVNVTLFNYKDSLYYTGSITDTLGKFELSAQKGKYLLQITMLGYNKFSSTIEIENDTLLSDFNLTKNTTKLNEIVITSSIPVIERKIDRLVFNVENMNTLGLNAIDVLQNTPGLLVSNNNIQIIGKGGIKVLINDREIKMDGGDLLNLLKSYSANEISKIEVITTPPARYDAEGNAGLVNIVLKKAKNNFFGGNIYDTQTFSKYNSNDIGFSLIYNKKQISSFLTVSNGLGNIGFQESNKKYYPEQVWGSQTDIKNSDRYFSLRGGLDYQAKKQLSYGIHLTYNRMVPDGIYNNNTNIFNKQLMQMDSVLISKNNVKNNWNQISLNGHIDKTLDSAGKKVLFDVDYLDYRYTYNDNFVSQSFYYNMSLIPNSEFLFDDDRPRNLKDVSSSLNFFLPFHSFTVNAGGKISYTKTHNSINYFNSSFPENQDNDFVYRENIVALYADFEKKLSRKIDIKFGLRVENTNTTGNSKTLNEISKNNYVKFFPTAYFLFNPNNNHSFNFNISNRIGRPRFNMVDPFRLYTNKYNYVVGKPDLKPSLTYNASFGYTLKNNFNVNIYYSYTNDVIAQLLILDSIATVTSSIWDNYMKNQTIGITNSYTFNKSKWLQSFIQHGLYYIDSKSNSQITNPQRSGIVYYIAAINTFYLTYSKKLLAQLSASYRTKQYDAAYIYQPQYDLSVGVRYNLLNNNLSLGFRISDLLISRLKGTSESNGIKMTFDNIDAYTAYKFTINYKFGATLSSKKRNYSNTDIESRL